MVATPRKMTARTREFALALALLAALMAPTPAQAKPGHLDRSFGDGGRVVTNFCVHPRGFSVVIDHHGRIVVAGTDNHSTQFCVARYHRDGSLDRSFSGNGRVRTSFGAAAGARSVAIDSRGRIVAGGGYGLERNHINSFALARYRPNGTLDPSFGADGKVTTAFGGHAAAESVAIDSHDRIVAAGGADTDFALARYRWNGSLDPSFGTGGEVATDFGASDTAYAVTIDSRRRIVATGETLSGMGDDFGIARYDPDGSPDTSFGAGGQVTTDFGGLSAASSVAVDSRDRVVAAGGGPPDEHINHFALARYWRNGSLDSSFSGDGRVTTSFEDHARASSVAIDSRGRIVAVGGAFDVARYKRNGRLDRSFGGDGKVRTGWLAGATSAAIDSRDRVAVVGEHSHLLLARFIGYRRP
jgi:uncharacterized delta-60 repeat protein